MRQQSIYMIRINTDLAVIPIMRVPCRSKDTCSHRGWYFVGRGQQVRIFTRSVGMLPIGNHDEVITTGSDDGTTLEQRPGF